jgi:hypothetical protein
MGQCLAIGASFANHTTKGGDFTEPTANPAVGTVIAKPITQVRAGCLSCHNNTTQYNSMSGRWKSDYLKTGHKNMLRKVTPGSPWAGPNANGELEVYASWGAGGANTIDWIAGTTTVGATTYPLMYIFGDWMAPAPEGLDVVNWAGTTAKYNNGSGYSCAACHATGWRNEDTTKGMCSKSSFTTQATCEANSGIWYPSSGAEGYAHGGAEPAASFPAYAIGTNYGNGPTIPGITGQWDFDGINCNRCHKVAYDPTLPINDEGVHAPPGFTTHETDIFDGWKCVATCYGCHQGIAKENNGLGANNEIASPAVMPVKNTAVAPAYIPEFNSHVIGGSFLNSPHAKYTGGIVPNVLGKYDLVEGGTFASTFKGKLCRSSTAIGGGSILETKVDGHVIASLEDCNRANGKPVGDAGNYGYWQDENQGSCITCHNVHESLFVADAKEPIRRECTACHSQSVVDMGHPTGAGTPEGLSEGIPAKACEACHMPKATSGGFPMHLWRINASASYRTFPTAAEFGIGATATYKNAKTSPDGSYTNAVWVDVDYACGQCHGGGDDPASSPYGGAKAGIPYYTKTALAAFAENMHGTKPTASFSFTYDAATSFLVNFDASLTTCPSGSCSYSWDFGDTTTGAGVTTSHTYADGTQRTVVLTVTDVGAPNSPSDTASNNVTPQIVNHAPAASFNLTFDANTWAASVTDTSTDSESNIKSNGIRVLWGDGASSTGNAGDTFNHTYTSQGMFTINLRATDTGDLFSEATDTVAPANFSISGSVLLFPGASATLDDSVLISLKQGSTTNATTYTNTSGAYAFPNVKAGTYDLTAYKSGVVFVSSTISGVSVGPNSAGNNFQIQKNKFKITSTALGSGGAPIQGVTITVKKGTQTMAQGLTNASGVYATGTTLTAGTYTVTASKYGRAFSNTPQTIVFANGDADGALTFNSITP